MTPGAGIFRTKLPQGFLAGGINCGVRKYRPDIGVIVSEVNCVTTAVTTQNAAKGAPVLYCENLLPSTSIKAIVTNSGEANAATGVLGAKRNQQMAEALASNLNCEANQVLTASTGVIGKQLSIDKISSAMPRLLTSLSSLAEKFALSILTTDLVPKTVHRQVTLSTGTVTLTGICKGSGMIHPNMATMLGYLLSDVFLSVEQSKQLLKKACDKSFNRISVDGDTSTNDCVFLMTNGMSGCQLVSDDDFDVFYQALEEVAIMLAKSIARDGEGASKLVEVQVKGLACESTAVKLARSLTQSSLIKTALYGQSPNWGRVYSRIGQELAAPDLMHGVSICIQGVVLYEKGQMSSVGQLNVLEQLMRDDTILIEVDFHQGPQVVRAWGCDLSEQYVKINAEYLS